MTSSLERAIDRLSGIVGNVAAVMLIALVLVTFVDVVLRYYFESGSIAMQEMEWHLYAMIFLLGICFTMRSDAHVRVDVFYTRLQPRTQALINMLGVLLFVLPLSTLIVVHSWSFVEYSFEIGETSPDPGGLPYTYLIKAMIPLAFVLTILSGIAFFLRNLRQYRTGVPQLYDEKAEGHA